MKLEKIEQLRSLAKKVRNSVSKKVIKKVWKWINVMEFRTSRFFQLDLPTTCKISHIFNKLFWETIKFCHSYAFGPTRAPFQTAGLWNHCLATWHVMARCQGKGWTQWLQYLAPPTDQDWAILTLVKTIYYHGVEDFVNHERNILSVTLQIAFFIAYSFKVYAWIQEFVWKNIVKPHHHSIWTYVGVSGSQWCNILENTW